MIRLGWVAEAGRRRNLPHAYANLSAQFRSPDWDPGRAYSYPWTGISTVIAYNNKATGGEKVDSVTQLLDDPTLKGRVGFLTEMRDTRRHDPARHGQGPGEVHRRRLRRGDRPPPEGRRQGQIRRFTGNDYTSDLDKGDFAACIAWAGDVVQLKADNPDIEFVDPGSGYMTSTRQPAGPRTRPGTRRTPSG